CPASTRSFPSPRPSDLPHPLKEGPHRRDSAMRPGVRAHVGVFDELDVRIKGLECAFEITSVKGVVMPAHDLHVLLRHLAAQYPEIGRAHLNSSHQIISY